MIFSFLKRKKYLILFFVFFQEFFLTVKDIIRQSQKMTMEKRLVKWDDLEKNLFEKYVFQIVGFLLF